MWGPEGETTLDESPVLLGTAYSGQDPAPKELGSSHNAGAQAEVRRPRLHYFFSPLEEGQHVDSSSSTSPTLSLLPDSLTLTQRQMGGFPVESLRSSGKGKGFGVTQAWGEDWLFLLLTK